MKHVDVVIGAGYGDEGKGAAVDWLCRGAQLGHPKCGDFGPNYEGEPTAVVRFNGGAQAGHTVVTADGRRHVFSQFGSGTFVGCPTILSRHMLVNPVMFWKEAHALSNQIDVLPRVYVDPYAKITTPWDVFINQELERSRGNDRHGSCGMGIGETEARAMNGYDLYATDLLDDDLEDILDAIEDDWLPFRLGQMQIDPDLSVLETARARFLNDVRDFIRNVEIVDTQVAMDQFDNIIMEGAQGLFLDAESEDFPHVTRSRTNSTNVIDLMPKKTDSIFREFPEVNVWYVTRSYLTRHGAGPLKGEHGPPNTTDATNVYNEFQQELRYAPLDFDRMAREIAADKFRWEAIYYDVEVRGIMSHMDQHLGGLSNDDNLAFFEEALDSTLVATFDNPCWCLD